MTNYWFGVWSSGFGAVYFSIYRACIFKLNARHLEMKFNFSFTIQHPEICIIAFTYNKGRHIRLPYHSPNS